MGNLNHHSKETENGKYIAESAMEKEVVSRELLTQKRRIFAVIGRQVAALMVASEGNKLVMHHPAPLIATL